MTSFIKVYFLTVLFMYIVNFYPFHTPFTFLSVLSLFFFPRFSNPTFHVLFCLWHSKSNQGCFHEHGWEELELGLPFIDYTTEENYIPPSTMIQCHQSFSAYKEMLVDTTICSPYAGNLSFSELISEMDMCPEDVLLAAQPFIIGSYLCSTHAHFLNVL